MGSTDCASQGFPSARRKSRVLRIVVTMWWVIILVEFRGNVYKVTGTLCNFVQQGIFSLEDGSGWRYSG